MLSEYVDSARSPSWIGCPEAASESLRAGVRACEGQSDAGGDPKDGPEFPAPPCFMPSYDFAYQRLASVHVPDWLRTGAFLRALLPESRAQAKLYAAACTGLKRSAVPPAPFSTAARPSIKRTMTAARSSPMTGMLWLCVNVRM